MSELQIQSYLSQISTVVKYELIKYVRGKKIHAIFGIAIFIPLLIVLTPEIFEIPSPSSVNPYLQNPLNFAFYMIVIAVAFLGSGSIVSEFHDKTGYALFPNPIKRHTIWFGKFIGAEITSFVVISFYYGVISFAALYKYESLPIELAYSLLYSFVVVTAIMSIAFLASTVFRSSTGAVVFVFLLFILVLPITDQIVMTLAETKPIYSPGFASGVIKNLLTNPYPSDLVPGELPRGPFDLERFVPYVNESLILLSVYIIACSGASLLLFRMKEMN